MATILDFMITIISGISAVGCRLHPDLIIFSYEEWAITLTSGVKIFKIKTIWTIKHSVVAGIIISGHRRPATGCSAQEEAMANIMTALMKSFIPI